MSKSANTAKSRRSTDAQFLGEKIDKLIALLRTAPTVNTVQAAKPDSIYRPNKLLQAKDGSLYTLEWSHTLGKHTYAEALKACKALTLGGHTDWVLPERVELESLLDLSKHSPASSAPDTRSEWYWSATLYAPSSSGYAWSVYFGNGDVDYNLQGNFGFVRACRRVPARQALGV